MDIEEWWHSEKKNREREIALHTSLKRHSFDRREGFYLACIQLTKQMVNRSKKNHECNTQIFVLETHNSLGIFLLLFIFFTTDILVFMSLFWASHLLLCIKQLQMTEWWVIIIKNNITNYKRARTHSNKQTNSQIKQMVTVTPVSNISFKCLEQMNCASVEDKATGFPFLISTECCTFQSWNGCLFRLKFGFIGCVCVWFFFLFLCQIFISQKWSKVFQKDFYLFRYLFVDNFFHAHLSSHYFLWEEGKNATATRKIDDIINWDSCLWRCCWVVSSRFVKIYSKLSSQSIVFFLFISRSIIYSDIWEKKKIHL